MWGGEIGELFAESISIKLGKLQQRQLFQKRWVENLENLGKTWPTFAICILFGYGKAVKWAGAYANVWANVQHCVWLMWLVTCFHRGLSLWLSPSISSPFFCCFGAINLVSVALNLNPSPVLALNNLVEFLASLLFARNRKLFGQLEGGVPFSQWAKKVSACRIRKYNFGKYSSAEIWPGREVAKG